MKAVTFRIDNFVFSSDYNHFSHRHPALTATRRGMSGCVYGQSVPVAGELWHKTASFNLTIKYPVLMSPDFEAPDAPQLEDLPLEMKRRLPPNFEIAVLCQIAMAHGAETAYDVATRHAVFMPSMARIRPLFVAGAVERAGVIYNRRPFPELPSVETLGLSMSAPHASFKNFSVYADRNGTLLCAQVGGVEFYAAQPEGRGAMMYKVVSTTFNSRIFGAERFGDNEHPQCEIAIPGGCHPRTFVEDVLISRRLGDILVLRPELAARIGYLPRASSWQLRKVRQEGNLLFHPEHGVLQMEDGAELYAVPYVGRGHD